jgi:Tfp pilus assembly pilus retraction ATPase PilT
MAGMYSMKDLLELVVREGAEELRLQPGKSPVIVLRGELRTIDVRAVTTENVTELFRSVASEKQLEELHKCGDLHFIYLFQNSARFAVTAERQREDLNLKIRNLGR